MIKSVFITVMCVLAACDSSSFTVGGAKISGPYLEEPTSADAPVGTVMGTTPKFWVAFSTPNAKSGDVIAARLVAVESAAAAPNTQVAETSATVPEGPAGASGTFNFSAPTAGWPPGKYMVQLTRNGAIMASTTFPVALTLPKN